MTDWDSHREQAVLENIDFLMNTCGMAPEQVARRLGITVNTLEKKLTRRAKREGNTDPAKEQGTGEGPGGGKMPALRVIPGGRLAPPERSVGA